MPFYTLAYNNASHQKKGRWTLNEPYQNNPDNQNDQVNQNDPKEKKEKKNNLLWKIITLILIIIIILLLLLRGCSSGNVPVVGDNTPSTGIEYDEGATEGDLEHASKEEIQAALNEKVAQSEINISMNPTPVFETGTSEGNLLIMNNEVNNYPQRVTIIRNDTGEQIYQTKAIPVGSKIQTDKLDVDLDAGTYECIAYFENLDPETGDALGRAGANITITIQN